MCIEKNNEQLNRTIYCPMPFHSSHAEAILRIIHEENVTIQTMPEEDDCQIIVNILANILYQGKNVLVISKDMAVLQRIQGELSNIQMNLFSALLNHNEGSDQQILKQKNQLAELTPMSEETDWDEKYHVYTGLHSEMQEYFLELHGIREIGFSFYDALVLYWDIDDDIYRIHFHQEEMKELSAKEYLQNIDLLERLAYAGKKVKEPSQNPWKYTTITELNDGIKDNIYLIADTLKFESQKTQNAYVEICRYMELPVQFDYETVKIVNQCVGLLCEMGLCSISLIRLNEEEQDLLSKQLIDLYKQKDELREKILTLYEDSLLEEDVIELLLGLQSAEHGLHMIRFMKTNKILKVMHSHYLSNQTLKVEDAILHLQWAVQYLQVVQEIGEKIVGFDQYYLNWDPDSPDWEHVKSANRWAKQLKQVMEKLSECMSCQESMLINTFAAAVEGHQAFIREKALRYYNQTQSYFKMEKELAAQLFSGNQASIVTDTEADNWFEACSQAAKRYRLNINKLESYCQYNLVKKEIREKGLHKILYIYEKGELNSKNLVQAYQKSMLEVWISSQIENSPFIKQFSGSEMENKLLEFMRADDWLKKSAAKEVRKHCVNGMVRDRDNLMNGKFPCVLADLQTITNDTGNRYTGFDTVIVEGNNDMSADMLQSIMSRGKQTVHLFAMDVTKRDVFSLQEPSMSRKIGMALNQRGLQVDYGIGWGLYTIHVAVKDLHEKGSYILGIVCDDKSDVQIGNAHDMVIVREEILGRMNIHMMRIWALDWLWQPEAEIEKIMASIEMLSQRPL